MPATINPADHASMRALFARSIMAKIQASGLFTDTTTNADDSTVIVAMKHIASGKNTIISVTAGEGGLMVGSNGHMNDDVKAAIAQGSEQAELLVSASLSKKASNESEDRYTLYWLILAKMLADVSSNNALTITTTVNSSRQRIVSVKRAASGHEARISLTRHDSSTLSKISGDTDMPEAKGIVQIANLLANSMDPIPTNLAVSMIAHPATWPSLLGLLGLSSLQTH